jgi:hypothetical protein
MLSECATNKDENVIFMATRGHYCRAWERTRTFSSRYGQVATANCKNVSRFVDG